MTLSLSLQLKNGVGGTAGKTPTLTPLVDWTAMNTIAGAAVKNLSNAGTGISAYGGDSANLGKGDLYLKETYKNYDAIYVVSCNDAADLLDFTKWDKWEVEKMLSQTYRFNLLKDNTAGYWHVWCSNKGTTDHVLSSETVWYCQAQDCGIVEIYGVKY